MLSAKLEKEFYERKGETDARINRVETISNFLGWVDPG